MEPCTFYRSIETIIKLFLIVFFLGYYLLYPFFISEYTTLVQVGNF